MISYGGLDYLKLPFHSHSVTTCGPEKKEFSWSKRVCECVSFVSSRAPELVEKEHRPEEPAFFLIKEKDGV